MMVAAQILLTVVVLGFSAVPARADLNETHAANPLWTGHARYHVVWQVGSYLGLGVLALVLLWAPGEREAARANLVALIAACVYGGFFGAAAFTRRYGGRFHDENGYPPITLRVLGRRRQIDQNLVFFSICVLAVAVACALVAAS